MKTYPEMNEKVANIPRHGGKIEQYAAQYIEELRKENEELQQRAKAAELTAETAAHVGIDRISKLKHRAEVAEKALELCETAYILALNGKQHEGISQQAIVSDLGGHKFFMEQAEKELLEEQI